MGYLIIALLPLILFFVAIDVFAWIVGGWSIKKDVCSCFYKDKVRTFRMGDELE